MRKIRIAKSATEALKVIWEEKFFWGFKKYTQIEEQLGGKGYHFTPAELCTALGRAKYLTRRGKKGNFGYIQKYPFVEEEKNEKSKKNN